MRFLSGLILVLSVAACGPSAIDGGFDSANPAARMYAIEQAAKRGDQSAVRDIVQQLDSDDPAVRLLAIGALERLTGQTYGYCHADEPDERAVAIARWKRHIDDATLADELGSADHAAIEVTYD